MQGPLNVKLVLCCKVKDWKHIQLSVLVIQVGEVTNSVSHHVMQGIIGKIPSTVVHTLTHCRSTAATRLEYMHILPKFQQLLTSRIFKQTLDGGKWSASHLCRFTPRGKKPPVPIEWEAELATEPVWTFKTTDKLLVHAETRTRHRPARSLTL